MQLDEMVQYLIAIGASIGADCKPCLQSCIALARQCGADEQDIEAAMAVGRKVKECAEKIKKSGWQPEGGIPSRRMWTRSVLRIR